MNVLAGLSGIIFNLILYRNRRIRSLNKIQEFGYNES